MVTISRIRIGADEIILRLRKNDKAEGVDNKELGRKIKYKICNNLGGNPNEKEEYVTSYWAVEQGAKNIGDKNLPKTAAQYEIDICRMCKLYRAINKWYVDQ